MSTSETTRFLAFGLCFEAPSSLVQWSDEFPAAESCCSSAPVDVLIRVREVPDCPGETSAQYFSDSFVLSAEGVARYEVLGGSEIVVSVGAEACRDEVALFLFSWALGALIHQRGLLPLHASSIQVEHRGVLFLGPSGVGKSTLAAALGKRGWRVVADDIAVVSIDQSGTTWLDSGLPWMKLWKDTVHHLGADPAEFPRVIPRVEKFHLPLGELDSTSLPLSHVYLLNAGGFERPWLQDMVGREKMEALIENTYRYRLVGDFDIKARHFDQCARVAERVPFSILNRPDDRFALDEMVELLENRWSAR